MASSIVFRSAAMADLMTLAGRVAATDANVLITGESGTGKSLFAEHIHRSSARRGGPFVVVPCANIQAELFESELFGHEPGAHTDAVARRAGRLEVAQKGTLFLDGVGALTSSLQAKLLRVIQERAFERLGGTETLRLDVRIIASGGEDLESETGQRRFRDDLFYRLNVMHLRLPPLRERPEDIGPLASHFLRILGSKHGGGRRRLTTEARRAMRSYAWPGNVRELANVLERAVISTDGRSIGPEALALMRGTPAEDAVRTAFQKRWSLVALEASYIEEILREARGNKSRAAAILGINRKTLLQKLKRSKH